MLSLQKCDTFSVPYHHLVVQEIALDVITVGVEPEIKFGQPGYGVAVGVAAGIASGGNPKMPGLNTTSSHGDFGKDVFTTTSLCGSQDSHQASASAGSDAVAILERH